jgi:hypothetical protein
MDPFPLLGAAALALQQTVPAAGSGRALEWGKLLVPAVGGLVALWLQGWRAQKASATAGVSVQPLPPPTETTEELRIIALESQLSSALTQRDEARRRVAELERMMGAGDL